MAKQLFKDNDEIITTNYDCFLEGLLDYYNIWHTRKGYANVCDPSWMSNSPETKENPKGIKFYKIHGSENFRECNIFDDKGETKQTMIGFIINENIYPVSGKNSNLGWVEKYCKECIIAPSFIKTFYPQIERMMIGALQAAAKAKNFVIIGCGLRPEDSFLWLLVTAFLHSPENGKIIIDDPCAERIKDKIWEHYTDINKPIITICRNLECSVDELISKLHNTCS